MTEQHVVKVDQLDFSLVRFVVRVLVDEPWPVSTCNTPNLVVYDELAGLRADISGRWLAAARVVIALWRDVSGICFGTWCALRGALRCTERECCLLIHR
jgi:hypothetical protein